MCCCPSDTKSPAKLNVFTSLVEAALLSSLGAFFRSEPRFADDFRDCIWLIGGIIVGCELL